MFLTAALASDHKGMAVWWSLGTWNQCSEEKEKKSSIPVNGSITGLRFGKKRDPSRRIRPIARVETLIFRRAVKSCPTGGLRGRRHTFRAFCPTATMNPDVEEIRGPVPRQVHRAERLDLQGCALRTSKGPIFSCHLTYSHFAAVPPKLDRWPGMSPLNSSNTLQDIREVPFDHYLEGSGEGPEVQAFDSKTKLAPQTFGIPHLGPFRVAADMQRYISSSPTSQSSLDRYDHKA
jgi:hypothetical protein